MTPEVLTNEQLKALTVEACILKGALLNAPGDYKKSLESLIGIIGGLTDRLSAETQRREAAEAVVDAMLAWYDAEVPESPWKLSHEYRAQYPKESFDWQCPACGRTNPSTDTHCGCRYESPEEA